MFYRWVHVHWKTKEWMENVKKWKEYMVYYVNYDMGNINIVNARWTGQY